MVQTDQYLPKESLKGRHQIAVWSEPFCIDLFLETPFIVSQTRSDATGLGHECHHSMQRHYNSQPVK